MSSRPGRRGRRPRVVGAPEPRVHPRRRRAGLLAVTLMGVVACGGGAEPTTPQEHSSEVSRAEVRHEPHPVVEIVVVERIGVDGR